MSLLMETASCKIQEEIVWKLAWSKSEEEYDALLRSLSEQSFRYFRNIDPETFRYSGKIRFLHIKSCGIV
jgi:hypothetical protein